MKTLSILLIFCSSLARAEAVFEHIRQDHMVPEACRQLDLHDFASPDIWYFTYGSKNSQTRGFDYAYPLWSDQLKSLFRGLQKWHHTRDVPPQWSETGMHAAWDTLRESYAMMGFPLQVEGEVLEIIAEAELLQEAPDYFVTGSIAYQSAPHRRVLGELDLVIGERRSCRVLAVGEVKLGKKIGKARRQLQRFRSFLRSQLGSKSWFFPTDSQEFVFGTSL